MKSENKPKNWTWLSGEFLKSFDSRWAIGEPDNSGGDDFYLQEMHAYISKLGNQAFLYDMNNRNLNYTCEFSKYIVFSGLKNLKNSYENYFLLFFFKY